MMVPTVPTPKMSSAVGSLVFAFFCAEEQMLRGSLEYTYYGTPLFALRDTKLMIQVDYIGELDGPYLGNYDGGEAIDTFLAPVMDDDGMPIYAEDWGGDCASDDCGFLWAGVPAYRFMANGAHHHQASDVYDALNPDTIARVADVVILGLGAYAF